MDNNINTLWYQYMKRNVENDDSSATEVSDSSGNKSNEEAQATLPSEVGKTTYITGFIVSGNGATVANPVLVTVGGLEGGDLDFVYTAVAGPLLSNNSLVINFPTALPASSVNVPITVTCPALGLGNTHNSVVATGYIL